MDRGSIGIEFFVDSGNTCIIRLSNDRVEEWVRQRLADFIHGESHVAVGGVWGVFCSTTTVVAVNLDLASRLKG